MEKEVVSIDQLDLHQSIRISNEIAVMRVPGGLIYMFYEVGKYCVRSAVFVPVKTFDP